ncbi:MAG: hypothetical protein QNJ44_00090 [Rhodobacter sp.]|nr:hypothetical protein [Rhodobacter sp.]
MRVFSALCHLVAAIALFTGGNDLIQGLEAQRAFGSNLTDQGFADPSLALMDASNSQHRHQTA